MIKFRITQNLNIIWIILFDYSYIIPQLNDSEYCKELKYSLNDLSFSLRIYYLSKWKII